MGALRLARLWAEAGPAGRSILGFRQPRAARAHSSGGERFLDTEEGRGSNPRAPTTVLAAQGPVLVFRTAPNPTPGSRKNPARCSNQNKCSSLIGRSPELKPGRMRVHGEVRGDQEAGRQPAPRGSAAESLVRDVYPAPSRRRHELSYGICSAALPAAPWPSGSDNENGYGTVKMLPRGVSWRV